MKNDNVKFKKPIKMILYIDTTDNKTVEISLTGKDGGVFKRKFFAYRAQAEKLLPEIDRLLKKAGLELCNLKEITVNNENGSFTSLRIGVVTANALGFALGIPVRGTRGQPATSKDKKLNVVRPFYESEPTIG